MKRLAAGAALTGVMLAPFSLIPPEQKPLVLPFDALAPLTPDQTNTINTSFEKDKQYLQSHQLGVASTKLAFLTDGQSTACKTQKNTVFTETAAQPLALEFCNGNNTVVISQAGLNLLKYLAGNNPALSTEYSEITLGHELGHAEQLAKHELKTADNFAESEVIEQQADCYSGTIMSHTAPQTIAVAEGFYQAINPGYDPVHGAAHDRYASFMNGAEGGQC